MSQEKAVTLMALSSVFVGFNSVLSKIALDAGFGAFTFIGFRFGITGLLFLLTALWVSSKLEIKRNTMLGLGVQVILQIGMSVTWIGALTLTDPINASIAFLLTPIIVYLGSVTVLHEPRSIRALSGSLVALVGGLLLFGAPSIGDGNSDALLGNGLLLISSVFLAAMIIHTKFLYGYMGRNYILGTRFFAGGLTCFVFALFSEGLGHLAQVEAKGWIALALGIIVSGYIGLSLFYKALRYMRAEDSSSLFYIDPLVGAVGAAVILGNTLSDGALVASSVILLGVLVAHPIHINRMNFYYLEHISRFDKFVGWIKSASLNAREVIRKFI